VDSVHPQGPERPGKENPAPRGPDFSAAESADSRSGPSLVHRSAASLLFSLKLPPDELSASILSFVKFFSLSLDSLFLGKIRRRVLAGQGGAESPPSTARGGRFLGRRFQEALTLGALASTAKGVELSPEALVRYARALLHGGGAETSAKAAEGEAPQEGRDAGTPGGGDSGTSEEEGAGAFGGAPEGGGGEDGGARGKEPGKDGPSGIRKLALVQEPFLDTLNRLPGKDGKRWIVLPFSLDELDICLRILLAPPDRDSASRSAGFCRVEQMALDIRSGQGSWCFVLYPDAGGGAEGGGQQEVPPLSLRFSCYPPPGQARVRVMERELADLLELPAAGVRGEGLPPFMENRDWILPSINEEV
jgi:hypothetical protein